MIKQIILGFSLLIFNGCVFADNLCFIAKEKNNTLQLKGECHVRYSPASTFKIPLALMGFDSDLLQDENNPEFPCKKEYDIFINACKGPHTPRTWMRDSCLWYSRVLTKQLGMERFRNYVKQFQYGNQDLSGDPGKNNGLTHAWLSSSLQISPEEQTQFVQKIINHTLPISDKSYEMTKKILFQQELSGGWKLYGKTGNGKQLNKQGQITELQHGWFVGWIEKGNRKIVFASHLVDDEKQDTFASLRAKNEGLLNLWSLINELEK